MFAARRFPLVDLYQVAFQMTATFSGIGSSRLVTSEPTKDIIVRDKEAQLSPETLEFLF
jgi:hypothetical protein